MTEMPVLGDRIKSMRIRRNMTQGDLAKGLCTGSMISQIETGKARPSYHMLAQIAQRLEVPVEFLIESTEANLEYIATYRAAQMLIAGRDYPAAMQLLKQLLNTQRGQADGTPLMDDLIRCYLQLGQVANAQRLVDELARLAESDADHGLMASVCLQRGMMQFQARRYHNAIYQWERGLESLSLSEDVDRYLYAGLLFHIAQAYAKLGQVESSLAYCARTAPYFEHARSLAVQARTCLGLAKSFRQCSDHRQAIAFGQRAHHLYDAVQHHARQERNRVQRALLIERTGRGQPAQKVLTEAVKRMSELGDLEQAGVTALELARWHLQTPDVVAAVEAYGQAQRWIPKHSGIHAKLQSLFGRIEAKRCRHSEGKQHIQAVVDTYFEQHQVFAWEEAIADLAWAHADEADFRQACCLLLSARTYSSSRWTDHGMCL